MPNKPGRPSKLTPEIRDRLLTAIKLGAPLETACNASGIAYATMREWLQRGEGTHPTRRKTAEYAEFAALIHRAIADSEMILLQRVWDASKTDPRSAQWLLSHRWPEKWADTTRLRIQVDREVEQQFDLLWRTILDDDLIDIETKRRIFEHASNLRQQASLAQAN